MLSRIRKRFGACVLRLLLGGAFGTASPVHAQTEAPDTLVLPALALPAPPGPLPIGGLPTSSRGARGAHWSVEDRELSAPTLIEKALQRNPAPPGLTACEAEVWRLALTESVRRAFGDYYEAHRHLEQLDEGLTRMRHCRDLAESRRPAGSAPPQDVLQAEVELGRLCERRAGAEGRARVACARLNALLRLPPEAALPPPPPLLTLAGELPEVGALHEAALARRPDMQTLRHRLGGGQAAAAPDRAASWQADLQRLTDQIHFEVEAAFAEVRSCEKSVRLLQEAVLQAARANAAAAESAYAAGRVPFLSLVEAERGLLEVGVRRHEALAEYHRRRAALARAIADPPPGREVSAARPRFAEVFHEKVYPAAHLTVPATPRN